MKRIYMALALVGGLAFGAKAQFIDLTSQVQMDSAACLKLGSTFTPSETAVGDSVSGVWGVINNGPESILAGDIVWIATPRNEIGFFGQYTASSDVPAGEVAFAFSYMKVDSIKSLIVLEALDTATTFDGLMDPPPYVNGKAYGFYTYNLGIGGDINNPENTDTVNNDLDFQVIIWNNCATSVEEMLVGKEKSSLTTYPNPAYNEVNFDYNFTETTKTAVARITDVTGRTVIVKDFGKNMPGKQSFNMDISALNPGMYIIEFSTDNKRAISKFSVK
jgi:hypothetical protein